MKRFNKFNYPWLLPIVIGLAARLYKLTSSSIWHDEGYTMWLLRYDFGDILARTARDVHPPGYYLLSKIWVSIFSNSVFSIRFFSVIFSLGIIYFTYRIIERIFNRRAAFWASLFLALSPFMIRFAQEARMYGVVAFFTTFASYWLVRFILERKNKFLIPYGLAMLVAIYTQYYAFFVIISHWLIVSLCTPGFWRLRWKDSIKKKLHFFNPYWWATTVIILLAYIPWFPIAYQQVTRVSASYWIQPEWITLKTIPNSILQFTLYSHLDALSNAPFAYWLIAVIFIGMTLGLLFSKEWKRKALLLIIYGYFPMILVFIVSKLRTPIYQDRYFPFSAVAIFALWGILISWIRNKFFRLISAGIIVVVLLTGNYYMHYYTNHQMKQLHQAVESRMMLGDRVVSGELYTFLDGIYYFGEDNLQFLSAQVDGYGETSLFYDRQEKYLVSSDEVKNLSNRIFVIGKSGDKDYFDQEKWRGFTEELIFERNGLKAVLYTNTTS